MYIVIYQDNKIKNIISSTYNIDEVVEKLKNSKVITKNDEYKVFDNIKNMAVSDIRAINDDGSIKSLGEQIKEKILILKENEVIKDGVVVELNPAYEEDKIRLIQRKLETLEETQKIEYDRENHKYFIIEKTVEEKYNEGLIPKEEYNEYIIKQRQIQYSQNLDGLRAELLDNVINSLAEKGLLNDSQMETLLNLQTIRRDIKLQYPKY